MDNRYKSCCNLSPGSSVSVNKLIGEIAIILANAISKENDANGVAQGYRAILFCLAGGDGVTQLEIANRVGIKPPSVSVALAKMESEDYITRRTSSEDLRKVIVNLTKKGRDIVNDMLSVFFDCDRVIASVLTDSELDTLTNLLEIVKERVYASTAEKSVLNNQGNLIFENMKGTVIF